MKGYNIEKNSFLVNIYIYIYIFSKKYFCMSDESLIIICMVAKGFFIKIYKAGGSQTDFDGNS